jgi:hypothetical protein
MKRFALFLFLFLFLGLLTLTACDVPLVPLI